MLKQNVVDINPELFSMVNPISIHHIDIPNDSIYLGPVSAVMEIKASFSKAAPQPGEHFRNRSITSLEISNLLLCDGPKHRSRATLSQIRCLEQGTATFQQTNPNPRLVGR